MVRCDGLHYDLYNCGGYQWVYWKLLKFGCRGYLLNFKWESMKYSMPQMGDRYFAFDFSFAIHILITWSCLVLLIANVSQIDWLCFQIFGISKQALDFVRDGTILRPIWKFSKTCNFLTTIIPLEIWFGPLQDLLHLGNLWRTKFLATFDGFHGSESLWVDFMI